MFELNNFEAMRISVASPERIRSWSHGEVTKPETINYRTQKPERDGLFCEKIFGPTHDWECYCGKYKRIRYKGVVCDKCGVEVTKSKVRRERMGHIELAAPVSHIWYFRGVPSRISIALDMSPKDVEQVLYFVAHIVLNPGDTGLQKKQVLIEKEYRECIDKYGANSFKVGMGAEAIKTLLTEINLDEEAVAIRNVIAGSTGQKRLKAVKRLDIIESFRRSGNRPEWMILDVLPVIPPEIRPMVQLDGGRFATSDLNDLYRRVINRNNRLKRLQELSAPDIIIRNEKRMLQEAVDALIDNGRRGKAVSGAGNRELKSLSGMLRGKQGRFRQNLLGKRVDYSGRSVIVVGPELKLYQCGLPKEMALELFKPFVMKELVSQNHCHNIKSAKRFVERAKPVVWDILENVIKDHPVLLNRAPTLHRLGIQAFEPVLVEGRALKIHPLVCSAFNADFDGDQMAVHVPLSVEAQVEARFLMLSTNNILKLSDGKPIVSPTQDMVIGIYYLTIEKPDAKGAGRKFKSANEAIMAYQVGEIDLQARITFRKTMEVEGESVTKNLTTTVGRIIFNENIPQDLGMVPRNTPEQMLDLEVDRLVDKKMLSKIIDLVYKTKGSTGTAAVLDKIKEMGFKYSTIGAITASVFDMTIPEIKKQVVGAAEEKILEIERRFNRGFLTDEQRYNEVIQTWKDATAKVEEELFKSLGEFNPIRMMSKSGARGNTAQIRQLAGMRGLMSDPTGRIMELPVKSSFREGLTVLEYFISSHGGRKGLADTALKTADSGYLTRRLVDVAQEMIIRSEDCQDVKGTVIQAIRGTRGEIIEPLRDRIAGRYTIADVINPTTDEIIVKGGEMISDEEAAAIEAAGISEVTIRSVLTCKARYGVCARCYGRDMASGKTVKIGEAVGTIAAQSIGEPGTQLTMRTFHTGGVATSDDITQGLPRVEELFEARKPKGMAVVSEVQGTVRIVDSENRKLVEITTPEGEIKEVLLPFGARLAVESGANVEPGTPFTQGSINPQDILRTRGVKGVQDYLAREVQAAYRISGVEINDKHVEIIVKQMLRKVKIENSGDTDMLPGELVDIFTYEEKIERTLQAGGEPATAKRTLLGITKASLATESFLAAASFQETARVLTDAAIKNKTDKLIGLKENVIIGKLIPAGTGMKQYRNIYTVPVNQPKVRVDLPNETYDDKPRDIEELEVQNIDLFGETEDEE
ncbi:MAG: DNA-directed RNA polymerase subunit beta' [Clostridiales bacterium]|jgi:DNA-directed RNA polymerase subunit beta'|nr:DNA-directed RNA polymerase subunit beta' [Clostridiales bacterium]